MAEILYKVFPPERLAVLQNRLLRFTPPEDFNDPFDIAPVALYRHRGAEASSGRPVSGFASLGESLARLMQSSLDAMVNRTFLNQAIASDSRGVLCLTECCTSLLMWAHYGASHRGFALGLDTRHPWLASARTVVYDAKRPTVSVSMPSDGSARPESDEYLYRKSDEWAYEKEWRIVRRLVPKGEAFTATFLRGALGKGKAYMPPSLGSTLFKVPYDAISCVVVGARMSEGDRTLLARHLAMQPRLRVDILACRLDPHSFRLHLERVPRRRFLKHHLDSAPSIGAERHL